MKVLVEGIGVPGIRLRLPDCQRFNGAAGHATYIKRGLIPEIKEVGLYIIKPVEDPRGHWTQQGRDATCVKHFGFIRKEYYLCHITWQRLRVKPGKRYRLEVTKCATN